MIAKLKLYHCFARAFADWTKILHRLTIGHWLRTIFRRASNPFLFPIVSIGNIWNRISGHHNRLLFSLAPITGVIEDRTSATKDGSDCGALSATDCPPKTSAKGGNSGTSFNSLTLCQEL